MIEYSYHYKPLKIDFITNLEKRKNYKENKSIHHTTLGMEITDLEQKQKIYEGVFSVMDVISDCTIFTGRIIQ